MPDERRVQDLQRLVDAACRVQGDGMHVGVAGALGLEFSRVVF
jgi:hypothetical protein